MVSICGSKLYMYLCNSSPLKRTDEELKELSHCLSYFPEFLPPVAYGNSLRLAVASRAIGEITQKESCSRECGCVHVCMLKWLTWEAYLHVLHTLQCPEGAGSTLYSKAKWKEYQKIIWLPVQSWYSWSPPHLVRL